MRRRNTTTEFLKECMADALLKLLRKKTIDEITVSEITETADVSRVSFYRHFKTKEEVLYFKCRLIGARWGEQLTPQQRTDPHLLTKAFFTLMESIQKILLTLYQANLHHIVLLAIYDAMKEGDVGVDNVYSTAFLAFGMFGILTEWIVGGCKENPEALAELTLRNLKIA